VAKKHGKPKACVFSSCSQSGCREDEDKCSRQNGGRVISHAAADQLSKAQAQEYVRSSPDVYTRVVKIVKPPLYGLHARHDKAGFGLVELAESLQ